MKALRKLRRLRAWLALVATTSCLALAAAPVAAQDDNAQSVEDFLRQRDKWPRLQGASLTIEGQYRILTDERLLFKNCDLLFQFAEGVRPPTVRGRTIQVTGALEMRQGKLTFVIRRIKGLPTDAETLANRRGRLPDDDAGPWYELADWAAGRGRFYEDSELTAAAADLRRSGVLIEYRQIGITEIEPLYALAQKTEKLGLPSTLRDEIVHDAVRREQRAAQKRDARQRDVVLTHILNRLPGAGLPATLDEATLALQREYEQAPLEVYRKSDADRRRTLHRLLYASAALERIELDAARDGSNGFTIARRIDETLPEYAARGEQYREREIDWQLQRIEALSREELLTLVERLRARDRAPRATEAAREWLAAHEAAFRERGSGGLLDLAEEHLELLNDKDRAAELYMELYQQRTGQETARARLVELGYQFDGARWTKADGAVLDGTVDAIRQGVVRRGMTSEQVRAAFGGPPTSVVRFAVRGQISELWVYSEHGVAIELSRRGAEGEAVAVEISELTGP